MNRIIHNETQLIIDDNEYGLNNINKQSKQKMMFEQREQDSIIQGLQGDSGYISYKQDEQDNEQNKLGITTEFQVTQLFDCFVVSKSKQSVLNNSIAIHQDLFPIQTNEIDDSENNFQKTYEAKDLQSECSNEDNLNNSQNKNNQINLLTTDQIYKIQQQQSSQKSNKDDSQIQLKSKKKQLPRLNVRIIDDNQNQYLQWMKFGVGKLTKKFIEKLKYLKKNRRIIDMTQEQYEFLNDFSVFNIINTNKRKQQIINFLEKWIKQFSIIPVFMPTNVWRICWDVYNMIHYIIFFIILSIMMFFNESDINLSFMNVYSFITLIIIILDTLIYMNTAFFTKDTIVIERKLILKEYIFSMLFITDFMSGFILSSKCIVRNQPISYNPNHDIIEYLQNLLIFFKLYSVSIKRKRFENIFTLKNYQQHIYRLFNQIASVLIIAHIASIGWYSIGLFEQIRNPQQMNWLQKLSLENEKYYHKYLYSLYWAITTMTTVGYGDISAQNTTEALFISLSMILFSIVFAYSINNIGSILQDIEKSSKQLQDNIQIVQKYLKRKNVNIQLKSRVRYYLSFLHEEQKDINQQEEQTILSLLSNKLREEITVEVNTEILKNFQIFNLFSDDVKKKLVFIMKETLVYPNEVIFNEGDYQDQSIYLIQNGIIQIFQPQIAKDNNIQVLQTLSKNEQFGELSFFTANARTASARSMNLSTVYKIDRQEFIELIREFKDDFERFKMIQDKMIFNKYYTGLQNKCYCCKQIGHIARHCPRIHQCLDPQFYILKTNFSVYQDRTKYTRNHQRMQYAKSQIKNFETLSNKVKTNLEQCSDFDYDEYLKQFESNSDEYDDNQDQDEEDSMSQISDLNVFTHGNGSKSTMNTDQNYQKSPTKNVKINKFIQSQRFIENAKNLHNINKNNDSNSSSFNKGTLHNLDHQSGTLNNYSFKLLPSVLTQQTHTIEGERFSFLNQGSTIQNSRSYGSSNMVSSQFNKKVSKQMQSQVSISLEQKRLSQDVNNIACFSKENLEKIERINRRSKQYKKSYYGSNQNIPKKNRISKEKCRILKDTKSINSYPTGMSDSTQGKSKFGNEDNNNNNKISFENHFKEQEDHLISILKDKHKEKYKDKEKEDVSFFKNDSLSNRLLFPTKTISKTRQSQFFNNNNNNMVSNTNINNINNNNNKQSENIPKNNINPSMNNIFLGNNQLQQQYNQFSHNYESMSLYQYYFPHFNYDRVIRSYFSYQLKQRLNQKQKKQQYHKQRRRNLLISDFKSDSRHSTLIQQLAKASKSISVDINSYKPTNLSYGTSFKGCQQYPYIAEDNHSHHNTIVKNDSHHYNSNVNKSNSSNNNYNLQQ